MSSGYSLWGNDDITDRNAPVNNPITSFNFVLEVEGVYFMALKSVKVFNKENEYEYIREGGVNDYVHMRRKPISKPFTFQVERYVGTERFLDPLANGTELILPVMLYVYRHKARSEIIDGAPAWPARIYTFTGCVVTAKEYGELNSEKSAILTETTTIAYRELMVVTNPFEGSQELPAWKFPRATDSKNGFWETKYANAEALGSDANYYKKDIVKFGEKDDKGRAVWIRQPDGDKGTTKAPATYREYVKEPDKKRYAKQTDVPNSTYYEDEVAEDGSARKKRKPDGEKGTTKPAQTAVKTATPKWASPKNVTSPTQYEERPDKDGTKHTVYIGGDERFDKPAAEEVKGAKPKWANQQNAVSGDHYKAEPGKGGWSSTDEDAKPRKASIDGATPEYAKGTNAVSGDHYKYDPETGWTSTDEDAKPRKALIDGAKPEYAKGTNAVSGDHYKYDPETGWTSTDKDAKPRKAEIKDERPAYAVDTNAVSADHYTPKPGEGGWELTDGTAKEPWDMKANKENPQPAHAEPARNGDDKAPAKEPWDMRSNKGAPKPIYAKPASNGDGLQPAKGPWEMKANASNPHVAFAKPATNGDGKQPAKEPWDIKANVEDPKVAYAVPAPNGDKKQTPVTWPPTRRALMAESLSKK